MPPSLHAGEPLVGDGGDGTSISAERLGALSMQAAVAVLRARRPLPTLRDVSGLLPSLARTLSRINLSSPAHEPLVRSLVTNPS